MHLPLLPLEALRPCWHEALCLVVLERDLVLALTPLAAGQGVRVGMRRGGVAALAPEAGMLQRDVAREQAALQEVALALLQYTAEVALADEASLLLDVTASLRAFNGHRSLCRRVKNSLAMLGFSARIGMAPTAHGAWLLACHRQAILHRRRRALRLQTLSRRLDLLPCRLLPAARPYDDWLEGIGCRTLGALRQLPRAGLQRRCGRQVLQEIDRAYGGEIELFNWVQAAPTFSARLELPESVEQAERLVCAARRLLLQMLGWLVAQQLAVLRFIIFLEHERGRTAIAPTPVEIALAEAAWHEEHLLRLLQERLGRIALEAPVIALRLEAAQVCAMAVPSASLFAEPGGTHADFSRLLELLTARLGPDSVLAPAPAADYRPEVGNQWLPSALFIRAPAPVASQAERPFWLLEKPVALTMQGHRPCYGTPLQLVQGPERIEAGWWDAACAVRDYFTAIDAEGACYWIYRERNEGELRWFLHGLFA